MLLVTDRVEENRSLVRILALWGRCEVVGLSGKRKAIVESRKLIVSDVEISSNASVDALRKALECHRNPGTPYLCFLRKPSVRATTQANAIGATAVLDADAPSALIVETINRLLSDATVNGGEAAQIQGHFVTAAAALADMLDAAAAGRAIPLAAVDVSVEAINRAADKADLNAWLDVVWNHDDLTYQHCMLVAGLAAAFAYELGFRADDRKLLTCAALLHDIGKAKIPIEILHKEGSLSAAELQIMRTHPQLGYEMLLKQNCFSRLVVDVARSHHEYLDGTGYPERLRGEQISDAVRMITICDIYAALIERRSYKAPMAPEAAYDILLAMKGKLDPALLRAFRPVVLADSKTAAPAGARIGGH